MLLQLAIGDAYGAGFEYVDADVVRACNDLSAYVQHPRHGIRPGRYTDDTQRSIAIAEAIISGEPWTPLMLAERFVAAFKRDPRQGYAGQFYDFLRRVREQLVWTLEGGRYGRDYLIALDHQLDALAKSDG